MKLNASITSGDSQSKKISSDEIIAVYSKRKKELLGKIDTFRMEKGRLISFFLQFVFHNQVDIWLREIGKCDRIISSYSIGGNWPDRYVS